jgi:hypothetical protein
MNVREKRLLIFFGGVIFAVVNVYGYNLYSDKMRALGADMGQKGNEILGKPASGLIGKIEEARRNLAERESKEAEMAWLAEIEPEPKDGLSVQSALQEFVTGQAEANSLSVDRPDIRPNDETGTYYHKAIFNVKVTGLEKGLYAWLTRLQDPESLRAITGLKLYPNREDDTLITAEVQVQQWYVPQQP